MKSRVFLLVCLITLVFILGTLWSIHDELPTIAHDVLYAVAVVSALGALFATWRLYLEVRNLSEYFPPRSYGVVVRKGKFLSPQARAFTDLVKPGLFERGDYFAPGHSER